MSHGEAAEEPGLATRAAACLIAAIAVMLAAAAMANEFLAPRGRITNVCGDAPCFAGGWAGP